MKSLLAALIFTASVPTLTAPAMPKQSPMPKPIQVAMVCYKAGEQVSGMNKICYYNCAGSQAAITVAAYQLCPLNINR